MDKRSEPARELLAQQREQQALRQETMRSRTEAELQQGDLSPVEAQARATMASQLQESDHLQASMLERSEEEVDQA